MEGKLSINPVAWSGDKTLKYRAWTERVKVAKTLVKKHLKIDVLR